VTSDQAVLLALAVLTLVCLVLVVALLRLRAASSRLAADLSALRETVEDLPGRGDAAPTAAATVSAPVEFVITDLGREREPAEPVHLDAPAFADVVLKETVVKAASFAHGVRRGLAPAARNRIRFEMKQEVRRSRKQRRADLKAAQRDLRARQRGALAPHSREAS
jgi:hypothetical protein